MDWLEIAYQERMKRENPDNFSLFDFNDANRLEKSFMQLGDVEISGIHLNEKEKSHFLEAKDKPAFPYNKNGPIDSILDELMQYSEPEQFERFSQEYLSKYDLDDHNLAELTREFFYRNLGSVFFPISDKAEAFDQMEELFFNKIINKKIYDFWKLHPTSGGGDEILFYLASQIGFEKRALDSLVRAYPSAKKFIAEKYFRGKRS